MKRADRATPVRLALMLGLVLTALGPRGAPASVIISEFLAANDGSLLDSDGDASGWIEIYNAGTNTVNLAGWHLTDDPAFPAKWTFPPTNLAPDRFLIVFASGKNRAIAGGELHTSFQLDNAGEYLALVQSDGQTIAHQFAPAYPTQVEGISFGVEVRTTISPFVLSGAVARWTVPSGPADLHANWAATDFDPIAWATGRTGLGFGSMPTNGLLQGTVTNLARARPATQSSTLGSFNADLAVNGSVSDFTHTQAGQSLPATWEVNLGTNFALQRIVIYNRADCCGSRLRDITVRILSLDGTTAPFTSALLNPENVIGGGGLSGPANLTLDLTNLTGGLVLGGRVRITRTPDPDLSGTGGQGNADEADVLSMAEVEVIGGIAGPSVPPIQTDLTVAMLGRNASALIRIPFVIPVEEMPLLDLLTLRMKYDDGFVAYLNGTEVARRNAPATLDWNSHATTAQMPDVVGLFEEIDLTPFIGQLQEGENVLAIQGLNVAASDADFLILLELVGKGIRITAEGYFAQPTPGAPNAASFVGFVADTKFSVDRGFYSQPFTVSITTETPDAEIRYTTNGSAPSAVNGLLYSGPIPISRTTVLRALATKPGYRPSNVDTHTYVFLSQVVTQGTQSATNAGFPTSWSGLAADYAMDPRITTPNAAQMESTLRSLPSLFISTSVSNLFDATTGIYSHPTSGGVAWERPASLEMLDTNGITEFQAECGLRIQGGYFRQAGVTHKHSLRVLFKDEYGAGRLHHDLFPGTNAVQEFDTFVLRAGANDGYAWSDAKDTEQFIRDQFGRDLQLSTGHPASHGKFVHLYLNGLYWGLYNLVERPNEDFSSSYFGGEPEQWDANNAGDIKSGDNQAWNAYITLVQQPASLANYQKLQGNNPDGARNPAYPVYLDKLDYIDYMIVNMWGGNWDWPWKNFWFGRLRTADSTGFKFYTWDYENTMGNNRARSPITMVSPAPGNESAGVAAPHSYLKNFPEYRMDFADRVHRFFFNGGLLTPQVLTNRYRPLADSVQAAIIAETARWGDDNLDPPQDQADWLRERDWILGSYLPARSAVVIGQFRTAGLYPSVNAPAFSQHGGEITNGFPLAMTHSNATGVIYYTLDGSDPRRAGGAASTNALVYSGPVVLEDNVRVKARVLSAGTWSALNEADFAVPGTAPLRITELMYHPAAPSAAEVAAGFTDGDLFEYVELRNVGPRAVNLAGISFVNGITFGFSGGILPTGERRLLVRNPAAFVFRYGSVLPIAGQYSGGLDNGGERLRLQDARGRTIHDFSFSDGWYPITDGFGFSLAIIDDTAPVATWGSKASWRASGTLGGSPGQPNPVPPLFPAVVINEVLSRPALADKVTVELANLGESEADVSGWWLSDDFRAPTKFRLPTPTVIPAGGFVVFTEDDFNAPAQGTNAFTFSPSGGEVRLFSADTNGVLTGCYQGWDFGASDPGVSFGRHVISTGADHFVAQRTTTLGTTNAGPRVGPILITEIMYRPPDTESGDNSLDEFVECRNVSSNAVDLFEAGLTTNHTWKVTGGIDFVLPANVTLAAGECLLLVNFDPATNATQLADFTARYGVPLGLQLFGPYQGKLDNSGEDVELKKPTLFQTGLSGYVMAEKVAYRDAAPWPPGADGYGLSLQRIDLTTYGNDPANWFAVAPTAAGAIPSGGTPPSITAQPESYVLAQGRSVTLSATATGTEPLRYQWRFNGGNLAGATNGALELPALMPPQSGQYEVLVYNQAGSVGSALAILVVVPPPGIVVPPLDVKVRPGSNAVFSVQATNARPMLYQWYFNNAPLAGATGSTLTVTNVQLTQDGAYSVTVSDEYGVAQSQPARLIVLVDPLILQPPIGLSVPQAATVTLSVAVTNTATLPVSYRWRKNSATLTNLVLNTYASFLTITNVQGSNNYSVQVTNLARIMTATPNVAVIALADADRDGLPDAWEVANGFNPNDATDALLDTDGDTMLNWQEYVAGTEYTNALSYLKVQTLGARDGEATIEFHAISNRTYSVLFKDSLTDGAWTRLADVPARTTNRIELIRDASPGAASRYYRLATPALQP